MEKLGNLMKNAGLLLTIVYSLSGDLDYSPIHNLNLDRYSPINYFSDETCFRADKKVVVLDEEL